MKEILRKMLGTSRMTYDELRTCLAGVAQVINDRPLCAVSAAADDLRPLTPSMFLRDIPVAEFPESGVVGVRFLQGSYRKMQDTKRSLQARFRKEYLGFLSSKNCADRNQSPKLGCMVLVGDSNKKRFEWPLGRVVELIPGKDGKVRVARIKTNRGILTRPLQRLYPLEIPNQEQFPLPQQPQSKVEMAVCVQAEDQPCEQKPEMITKGGRVIKKPVKYGQWFN